MKPTFAQRKRIQLWIEKWRPRLFLNEWDIDLNYIRDKDGDNAATVKVDTIYFRASISIYPSFWEHRLKEQEHIIVHELCHCVSEPLALLTIEVLNDKIVTMKNLCDVRENLTQRLANIAFREEW